MSQALLRPSCPGDGTRVGKRAVYQWSPLYLAMQLATLRNSHSSAAVSADYTENCTTLHFDTANWNALLGRKWYHHICQFVDQCSLSSFAGESRPIVSMQSISMKTSSSATGSKRALQWLVGSFLMLFSCDGVKGVWIWTLPTLYM